MNTKWTRLVEVGGNVMTYAQYLDVYVNREKPVPMYSLEYDNDIWRVMTGDGKQATMPFETSTEAAEMILDLCETMLQVDLDLPFVYDNYPPFNFVEQ